MLEKEDRITMSPNVRKTLSIFAVSVTFLRCGAFKPDYVKYEDSTAPSTECTAALSAFSENIEPTIKSDCINCHTSTTIGTGKLSATSTATSRAAFLSYTGTSAEKLANHIGNKDSTPHGGGLKSEPSLDKIQKWLDAEKTCT
jgi:hypothetical protein